MMTPIKSFFFPDAVAERLYAVEVVSSAMGGETTKKHYTTNVVLEDDEGVAHLLSYVVATRGTSTPYTYFGLVCDERRPRLQDWPRREFVTCVRCIAKESCLDG